MCCVYVHAFKCQSSTCTQNYPHGSYMMASMYSQSYVMTYLEVNYNCFFSITVNTNFAIAPTYISNCNVFVLFSGTYVTSTCLFILQGMASGVCVDFLSNKNVSVTLYNEIRHPSKFTFFFFFFYCSCINLKQTNCWKLLRYLYSINCCFQYVIAISEGTYS